MTEHLKASPEIDPESAIETGKALLKMIKSLDKKTQELLDTEKLEANREWILEYLPKLKQMVGDEIEKAVTE